MPCSTGLWEVLPCQAALGLPPLMGRAWHRSLFFWCHTVGQTLPSACGAEASPSPSLQGVLCFSPGRAGGRQRKGC